jgi:transglutaminase-like putative cysteine protease
MDRRAFLKTGLAATAASAASKLRLARADSALPEGWRSFEVVMRAELLDPSGASRVWLPMPLVPDTDYHKNLGRSITGNAAVKVANDGRHGAEILCASWGAEEKAPVAEVTLRFATRDRAADLAAPGRRVPEDKAVLSRYLEPTRLIRTDGIVLDTSRKITTGKTSDVEKARALYEWVVENTFRDPKMRGCGIGDIRSMLETGNLGGKCADLNALFVGLCRAAGIPARDIYGIRVADSKEFKCLGKAGDITKAQHCRAEFFSPAHGWVPVDPADVRKVALEEQPGGLPLTDPIVERARRKLFGAWEMNYLAFNHAHDVALPASAGGPLDFLMYPQGETSAGRKDCLDPQAFRYTITSREIGPTKA